MPSRPNPFRDPVPFNRVRLGGRLILAVLIEFDGIKIVDGWKSDKSKSTSGSVAKFTGTKSLEAIKLTFKAYDERTYDDLRELYDLLAPVPGQGGTTTATAAAGQTSAVGSTPFVVGASGTANASSGVTTASGATGSGSSTPAAVPASSVFTAAQSSFGAGGDKKDVDPDPGPRPPTLPIEFAPCAELGVFAVARKSWESKYNEKDLSWTVVLELIQDKPPVPAGAGVMAAPKLVIGSGGSANAAGGTATAGGSTNASARAEAAGT